MTLFSTSRTSPVQTLFLAIGLLWSGVPVSATVATPASFTRPSAPHRLEEDRRINETFENLLKEVEHYVIPEYSTFIGTPCATGIGVRIDWEKARQLFEKAAQQNDP